LIGNRARRGEGEGNDHYNTKTLVAMLADANIGTLAREIGYELLTLYEFPFIPIRLEEYQDICDRCYVGDVVCLFFHERKLWQDIKNRTEIYSNEQIQRQSDHIINYECDDIKGHSTKREKEKNRIRDEQLLAKHNVLVHRIPAYSRKERINFIDTLKEDEILRYYFRNMPKVIA
jgi:hypothetical protein